MKYEVEFSGTAQVAHYMIVEADCPENALKEARARGVGAASFAIEAWIEEPSVESLSEDGALIASNYELDIANVEDYE